MRLKLLICVTAFLIATLLSLESLGKVASISYSDLEKSSDLIVVAKVQKITRSFKPFHFPIYATAEVSEYIKGKAPQKITYLASPSWTCDTSSAVIGETVLLFLVRDNESKSYTIAHSGRGRMPLQNISGISYASMWKGDIEFPDSANNFSIQDKKEDLIVLVEVKKLKELIYEAAAKSVP